MIGIDHLWDKIYVGRDMKDQLQPRLGMGEPGKGATTEGSSDRFRSIVKAIGNNSIRIDIQPMPDREVAIYPSLKVTAQFLVALPERPWSVETELASSVS